MLKSFLFFLLFTLNYHLFAQNYTISGRLTDSKSGEDLSGATVLVIGTTTGVATNSYGFYSLTLPKGTYKLSFRYVGYDEVEKAVTCVPFT